MKESSGRPVANARRQLEMSGANPAFQIAVNANARLGPAVLPAVYGQLPGTLRVAHSFSGNGGWDHLLAIFTTIVEPLSV